MYLMSFYEKRFLKIKAKYAAVKSGNTKKTNKAELLL